MLLALLVNEVLRALQVLPEIRDPWVQVAIRVPLGLQARGVPRVPQPLPVQLELRVPRGKGAQLDPRELGEQQAQSAQLVFKVYRVRLVQSVRLVLLVRLVPLDLKAYRVPLALLVLLAYEVKLVRLVLLDLKAYRVQLALRACRASQVLWEPRGATGPIGPVLVAEILAPLDR